jgi:hypothetical protein
VQQRDEALPGVKAISDEVDLIAVAEYESTLPPTKRVVVPQQVTSCGGGVRFDADSCCFD